MKSELVTPYPPKGRLIAAFVCAPLASALAFACFEPLYAGLPNYIDREFRTFLWYFLIGGLPTAAAVGVPTYLMLRRRLHPTVLNCILAGGVVAAFLWLVLLLLPNGTNYSFDDGHVTVLNGHRTAWGWIYGAQSILQVAAFGLIGGFTFWLVATFRLHPRRPEALPR